MRIITSIFILSTFTLFMSCSKDKSLSPNGTIKLQVSAVNGTNKMYNRTMGGNVVFTDFQLSFRDIKFYHNDDTTAEHNVKFRGPYVFDLLDTTDLFTQTIGSASVPNGTYDQVRFKLHESKDQPDTSKLYERSIYLAGTIDSIPFEMWHDTDENFDLGSSTGVRVSGDTVHLNIVFDIQQFLNSKHQIDLSEATDNNRDGVIEISNHDNDGNRGIAHKFKFNIKYAADLLEE